jgi:hypothetical protein
MGGQTVIKFLDDEKTLDKILWIKLVIVSDSEYFAKRKIKEFLNCSDGMAQEIYNINKLAII